MDKTRQFVLYYMAKYSISKRGSYSSRETYDKNFKLTKF
jgi:hypothetical protein